MIVTISLLRALDVMYRQERSEVEPETIFRIQLGFEPRTFLVLVRICEMLCPDVRGVQHMN